MAKGGNGEIDSQWFFDRLRDARLSLRGLAKLIGMSPSSLSLRLSGSYKITMGEATDLARLLGVRFEDVVQHAGIKIPKESVKAIRLIGTVDAKGVLKLTKGAGTVSRPGSLGPEAVAVRGVQDGWTYFYNPSDKLQPEAIGVLAVVENRWVGVLKRGSERGLWDVTPPCSGSNEGGQRGVKVTVATPVLMIVP